MKIITYALSACLLMGISLQTTAQDYLKINIGYNPNFNSPMIYSNNSTITADSLNSYVSSGNSSGVYGTLGNGLNLNASAGYKITDILMFEFGMNYFISSKYVFGNYYKRTFYGGNWYSSKSRNAIRGSYLGFTPSLVFSQQVKKFKPYAKFGVLLAYCNKEEAFSGENDSKKYGYWTYSGKNYFTSVFSLGLNACLGTCFSLGEKIELFGEMTMTNLYAKFEESQLASYSENGVDVLKYLTINQKNTQYVNSINSNDPVKSSEPSKRLSYPTSYSGIGFQVGLKINMPEVKINRVIEKPLPQAD